VLGQVRLVGESASQGNVAQGRIRLQHVSRGQHQATRDHKSVGRLAKSLFKRAGEMRFAAVDERAEIRNEHRPRDMSINISKDLARLPGQQLPLAVGNLWRSLWMGLLAQQCGGFEQATLGSVFLIVELTHSGIKEQNHLVHPFARFAGT
jgi:hypothetical protein